MPGKLEGYAAVAQSPKFRSLLRQKKRFLVSMSVFFLVFYFALPVLTAYSKVLNHTAFGSISWAWVFAFAQFIMTWALCIVYSRKAAKFDETVSDLKREVGA